MPQIQEGLQPRSRAGPKLEAQSTEQSSPVRAKQETGRGMMDLALNPAQTRKKQSSWQNTGRSLGLALKEGDGEGRRIHG